MCRESDEINDPRTSIIETIGARGGLLQQMPGLEKMLHDQLRVRRGNNMKHERCRGIITVDVVDMRRAFNIVSRSDVLQGLLNFQIQ